MEDSVNIQDYYQLRGTMAEGAADRWLNAVRRDARSRLSKMDPMMRKNVGAQIDRWTAGRYENLKAHEAREVRSGKISELSLRLDQSAASTAADIALSAESEARSIAERRSALMATPDGEPRAKALRALDDERARSNDQRLAQLAAETADREREWNNAVEQGLFSPEEARVRALANRKSAYSSTLEALLRNGSDDAAEAILDALDAEGGPADAKTGKGRKGHLGTVCGFDANDLARFRQQVDGIRRRRAAEAEAAREKAEREQLEQISLASREARANGSLGALEGAAKNMSAEAMRFPTGDRRRVAAMEEAKRLDAAADAEAKRLAWDGILDHAGDKEEWKPPKGSRMAKFHKALKESYDRQSTAYAAEGMLAEASAVQEERKANVATLRAAMMQAAAVDPGGFSARLAEAAEKGHITLDQYRKLRDDFNDVWMQKGMPQKGAALVQILKNEFYADADYDLNDRLAVNPKTGRFEYGKNPETKKPFEGEDVEFETTETVPAESHSGILWNIAPGTAWLTSKPRTRKVTHTLTSDEQLKMLDWAMELAQHDGEWISTDPQTGVRLDKPRKLDAAAEFQDACSRMKTMKRAQSSQDLVVERANAMLNLRAGFAQADDAVTGTAAKREAAELKTREALKTAKRKPFTPKMPGGARGGNSASEGEED